MVMQRRHAKNALAGELERSHLQNYRKRLQYKNSANRKQQNFLLNDHRNNSDRAANCQRTDIAHKKLRRMRVIPKESKRRAQQRAAKNRELAGIGNVLDIEIFREARIARDVGKHG